MKNKYHKYMKFLLFIILTLIIRPGCSCQHDPVLSTDLLVEPEPIAVWAYPDGVSLPYRDANNSIVSGSVNIGVVAYYKTGIKDVTFNINNTKTVVENETINLETGEYEYVLALSPASLPDDGEYVLSATATSTDGETSSLPKLKIQKDTSSRSVITASTSADAIQDALLVAESGDIIKVPAGTYNFPFPAIGWVDPGFTKYVTIMPVGAQYSVTIVDGGTLRSGYIKFVNIDFDLTNSSVDQSVYAYNTSHFWFTDCRFTGKGRAVTPSSTFALLRFYDSRTSKGSRYNIIEGCEFSECSTGIVSSAFIDGSRNKIGKMHSIIRNNYCHDIVYDFVKIDGEDILVSGNIVEHLEDPNTSGHWEDFIETNIGLNQAVIRNNRMIDGQHQGMKLGGYNDGRAQYMYHVAIINNLIAMRATEGVNAFRLGSGNKHGVNLLIEYNTIWNDSGTSFSVDRGMDSFFRDVVVRNNIFAGSEAVIFENVGIIDYNYHSLTPTRGLLGDNSVVGDPLFQSVGAWDFNLQGGSAAIDQADTTSKITYDLEWSGRDTITPTMGAYE